MSSYVNHCNESESNFGLWDNCCKKNENGNEKDSNDNGFGTWQHCLEKKLHIMSECYKVCEFILQLKMGCLANQFCFYIKKRYNMPEVC